MIWLVIPVNREGSRGAGQWKDIQAIKSVFDGLGLSWLSFLYDGRNLNELIRAIGHNRATVVWYYSFYPEAMAEVRRQCPCVHTVLRTVNAEAFQHWLRAKKDWRHWRGVPRDIYGCLRLAWRDRQCVRLADAIAGISSWDDTHYWKWFSGCGKIQHVPYMSPWPTLCPDVKPLPWDQRENVIACLAGSRDAIGRGHVRGFAALAASPAFSSWRFVASEGFMDASRDDLPANVERLGQIDDPWAWLCRVKVVAVLSPLGYGYKTTVTDALAAGCHVLVDPRQHARLSAFEKERAISYDPMKATVPRVEDAPGYEAGINYAQQSSEACSAWREVLS